MDFAFRCGAVFCFLGLRPATSPSSVFRSTAMKSPSPRVRPGMNRPTGLSHPFSNEPVMFQLSSTATGNTSAPSSCSKWRMFSSFSAVFIVHVL